MGGAGASLLSAWILPHDGLQDLGRVVLAMLLAALAVVPFLAGVLLGGGTMPRWMLAASLVGAAIGVVPALALITARM